MASNSMKRNSLVCFTNCALALEDGSIVRRDLWIDEANGVILDAQKTFFEEGLRPDTTIDLEGNILSPGFVDIQINGAYGFDFSMFHNADAKAYDDGLRMIARKIVETGVTSLLPTIITQQRELYPKLLPLLAPASHPRSATLLGWHAEGPFLQPAKRGAHLPGFLLHAPDEIASFEAVYGTSALTNSFSGVRVITVAPEIEGVIPTIGELTRRGVTCSIGHSIASSETARMAILAGARLITHLFNAMPQLHHRDPSIIGLLGASETATSIDAVASSPGQHVVPPQKSTQFTYSGKDFSGKEDTEGSLHVSEALAETVTPPLTPVLHATDDIRSLKKDEPVSHADGKRERETDEGVNKEQVNVEKKTSFERPFYGMIVDGCHSHPHSVRLAYTAHPEKCILITDAMPMLDPHLQDGIYDWRDGRRVIKEGVRLYIEGTDTLAGSVVTMDICVRNFVEFTGCTLGEAIKCATYNPAACLSIENRKGTLRPGADADLVLLDAAGNVKGTWVSGKKVWPSVEVGNQ